MITAVKAWFGLNGAKLLILGGVLGVLAFLLIGSELRVQRANGRAATAEAATARQTADQLASDLKEAQAFARRLQDANKAAQDALAASSAKRQAADQTLGSALKTEGDADASLAACLGRRLPDSVRSSLAR